jgi:glycosyltransferase involved in cell wall biosynthesis
MRVAILTENLAFGGINRYCLYLARGLGRSPGVEPTVWALPSSGDDWLLAEAESMGVEVMVVGPHPVRSVRRLVAERQIDIVHSQGYRSNLVARAALCRGRGRTKSVCTVHGAYYFASAAPRSKVYYSLDYLTMCRSHRVIAVSAATAARVSRWARGECVVVVHNGTEPVSYPDPALRVTTRRALGIAPEERVVCYVGRLDPQKGVEALAATIAEVVAGSHDVTFLLVGDGESRGWVEGRVRAFGKRVIITGARRDVGPYYAAADLLFMPSRSEGFPMALIEAFARGLPAVASNVGGVPEVLVEGYSGFLCERDDTKAMAKRIIQLAHDDGSRTTMGANARESVVSRFTVPAMVEATHRVYQSLQQ